MRTKQLLNERIDFHLHSLQSDGENSVKEIVDLALNREHLRAIALTDHNYFAVSSKYIVGTNGNFLEVLPGCEFSTTFTFPSGKKEEIHVIGIFPKGVNSEAFADLFAPIDEGKQKYIKAILESLHNLGVDLSMKEVMEEKRSTGYIGRFHIAKLMVKLGYGKTVEEIMDRYIGNYSPYYIPATSYIPYTSLEAVVERIQAQSGFPILAHPYSYHALTEKEIITLISSFKETAGDTGGLEVYYLEYTKEQQESLRKLAKEYDLVPSVASDRHRKEQPFSSYGGYSFYKEMLVRLENRKQEGK